MQNELIKKCFEDVSVTVFGFTSDVLTLNITFMVFNSFDT